MEKGFAFSHEALLPNAMRAARNAPGAYFFIGAGSGVAGEKNVSLASEKFRRTLNVPELSDNWCSSYNVEPSFTPGSASQMAQIGRAHV